MWDEPVALVLRMGCVNHGGLHPFRKCACGASVSQNILLHGSGHVLLTDFDLSYSKGVTTPKIEKVMSKVPKKVGGLRRTLSHVRCRPQLP